LLDYRTGSRRPKYKRILQIRIRLRICNTAGNYKVAKLIQIFVPKNIYLVGYPLPILRFSHPPFLAALWIRIRMFLGLPDPDPSINKKIK
jgi:hypothetical protein